MIEKEVKKYLSKIGSKGGHATKERHPPDYYKRIGQMGKGKAKTGRKLSTKKTTK